MGETEVQTERDSVKRKDSGMSGMEAPKTPETATPKARDFAPTTVERNTTKNRNVRNEKHDTKNDTPAVDKSSKTPKTPASVLGENKHKENLNMLRRMKNMALAPLHIGVGKA